MVIRRLSALPPSQEREQLRAQAEECRREAERWQQSTPAVEERERVMKRVLGLHVAVARLERASSVT
ncbi:MAG: hypothetical protein ACRELB_15915 [Polyangiaceae bacterium]